MTQHDTKKEKNIISRWWKALWRPSRLSLAVLLSIGFVAGILFIGVFTSTVEWTNTESFCISCHEMAETVYEEYKGTTHHENHTGVQAICPDCHVPRSWPHKLAAKIGAAVLLYHKVLGTIETPEKFETERLKLAQKVWKTMKDTDSRECRSCHNLLSMVLEDQPGRARRKHETMSEEGKTCIDCHKGIVHELPEDYDDDEEEET